MLTQKTSIQGIPALLWGESSEDLYLFVHGKCSRKEDAAPFAELAVKKGFQVLSFDLPEHGERKSSPYPCTAENGVHDLGIIRAYIEAGPWKRISLHAVSLGAYFSLLAFPEFRFEKVLFLSPVLDMERLIRNMMQWFHVSETDLKEKREIPTPIGETLSWPYYEYVKAHPIRAWNSPTAILYAAGDNITERAVVDAFAEHFHCRLSVMEIGGEHYFHTPEQLQVLDAWLSANVG